MTMSNAPQGGDKLQKLIEMKRELARRKSSKKAKYYIPNGKAEDFINLVGADKCFVSMFIGANGVGKSCIGANIVTNICYGVQSDWFKKPLFEKFPYLKQGRIISDPTTLREKIVPELKKWFPENESKNFPTANYKENKGGKSYTVKFTTNTGHTFDLMSTEQDLKEFESVDLGWVWIDEPLPKDKFLATIARMRRGGIIMMTYTPLFHAGWIKDWINDNCDGEYADYVEAEMEDNCKQHGIRGILEHKHIQRMIDAFPEDEKQARAYGKFGHLVGRVHKDFNRKVHCVKPFPLNRNDFTVYQAIDTHPRTPDHTLYMAVRRDGQKFIVGELLHEGGEEKSADRIVERMKAYENQNNYRIEDRIIEPAAFNDDDHHDENSIGTQLFNKGMNFLRGSKDLQGGIRRTDQALKYEMANGVMMMPPEVLVFDTCRTTIKQIEEYVWDEHKGRGADQKQKKATPRDKDDHMVEDFHRLLMHEPKFISPEFRNGGNTNLKRGEEDSYDPY